MRLITHINKEKNHSDLSKKYRLVEIIALGVVIVNYIFFSFFGTFAVIVIAFVVAVVAICHHWRYWATAVLITNFC